VPPSSSFSHAALPFLRVRVSEVLCDWLLNFLKQIKQISFVFVCVCFDLNILFQFADPCRMFSVNVTLVILSFKGGWVKVLTTRRLTRPPKNSPLRAWDEGILRNTRKRADSPITWKEKKRTWILKLAAACVFWSRYFSTGRSCVSDFSFYICIYILECNFESYHLPREIIL
jgi:hypothetical protein